MINLQSLSPKKPKKPKKSLITINDFFRTLAEPVQIGKNHISQDLIISSDDTKLLFSNLQELENKMNMMFKVFDTEIYVEDLMSRPKGCVVEFSYLNELEILNKLNNVPNFNSIYVKNQPDSEVSFEINNQIIQGKVIISKILKSQTITRDLYPLFKQQLDLIHNAGIVHQSLTLRDLIFCGGKCYIANYSRSMTIEFYKEKPLDLLIDLNITSSSNFNERAEISLRRAKKK